MNLEAVEIKVVRRRENGSGVIRIPVSKVAQNGEITSEMFEEVVRNFQDFPLVPVDTSPHKEFAERGGFQPGFVESLELVGDTLYAEIDLIASLFYEVVELGGWRGFSVEMLNGFQSQTKDLEGWVLVGGVFTNRPAVDAVFKIAAEAGSGSPRLVSAVSLTPEEAKMDEKKQPESGKQLAALTEERQALTVEKRALETRVNDLGAEVRDLRTEKEAALTQLEAVKTDSQAFEAKAKRLEAELRSTQEAQKALQATVTDLTSRLDAAQSENLSAKVLRVRDAAIEKGVPPAIFEGIDVDPADWMTSRYANFEAFDNTVKALMGVSRDLKTDSPRSAHESAKRSGKESVALSDETKQRLAKLGLDPRYANVRSERELTALKAEQDAN